VFVTFSRFERALFTDLESSGWFATKIFHPNVSSAGEICVNTLKKDWVASYGIKDILITVKCLLIHPNPESALDEEAGKLLLEDYESYCERARLITSVHATPRVRPKEFDTPAAKVQEAAGPSKIASPTLALPPQAAATAKSSASTPIPKSPSPQVQSQPLQTTTSNTLPSSQPNATSKEKEKERHTSPTPLSTADANVSGNVKTASSTVVNGSKAVKRTAQGMGGTGIEKRKKALKRL
jgi:ubiquitin-conjugating enzyme E2 S